MTNALYDDMAALHERLTIASTTRADLTTLWNAAWTIASAVDDQPWVDQLVADIEPNNRENRERVLRGALTVQLERVLYGGNGTVTHLGNIAYAVWLTIDPDRPRRPMPNYDLSLSITCGAATPRFRELDRRLDLHHPATDRYERLVVFAVRPRHQGAGLGERLVRDRLARCDEQGLPVFAPITNGDAVSWFERFGFRTLRGDQTSDPVPGSGLEDLVVSPLWRPAPQ